MSCNVALRAIEPEDVDLLYQWENDMTMWVYSDTQKPFSKHQLNQYIQGINLDIYQSKELKLIIETEEDHPQALGMIDLFDFDPYHNRAGVGIMIHKDFEGQGFASEALKLFKHYCFNTLGIMQLYCSVACNNEKSIRLFERNGFEQTGLRKKWRKVGQKYVDERFYQLINS